MNAVLERKKESALTIGEIGEQLVNEFYNRAVRTDNWFDDRKDGMISHLTYEVKTFRLNFKTQGFWVDESQFKKLDGVDLLFFVKVPERIEDGLSLFLATNHHTQFESFTHRDKRMRSYPLAHCWELGRVEDERVNIVYENSISISKFKRYD